MKWFKNKNENENNEELRTKYERLLTKWEKTKDQKTLDEINRINKILKEDYNKTKRDKPMQAKPAPVIHDKVLDRAKEIASSYGKDFDELSDEKQNKLIEKADLELQGDEVLESLMNEPEPNKELDMLRRTNQKLEQEITQTQVVLGDMQRKLVDLGLIIEDKESEIKSLKVILQNNELIELEQEHVSDQPNLESDSQIAYDLIQKHKERQLDPKQKLAYQLGKLELYCLSCKHTIQAHAKGGESNGCGCGCLRTIEDIALENKIPLITKNNYKKIHNGTKRESFISKNFIPKKETKIESIEDIPLSPSIIKQANAIKSMMTTKKPATELERRAQVMQINTQQKLREESKRTKDLAEVSPDSCTCGHNMDVHFESSGFCTEMDCPCDQFRDYPK